LSPAADAVTKKKSYVSGIVSSMQWGFDFVSIVKYFFILILLALMGINVFSYLGDAGNGAAGILGKFIDLLSGVASGVKSGIKVVVTQTMKTSVGGIKANVDNSAANVLNKRMDEAGKEEKSTLPQPDSVSNVMQRTGAGGKSGYCYIGEDRGFRSCVRVGNMDKCMSGDIFPTEAICINPNLRE